MAEPGGAEPRYRAFLSYSHEDAAIAARLHRRLEGYRLPRRLAGRSSERGPIPQRLLPIFRDREELAASTDLSETVRAALQDSAALIVLCSPAAARAQWVAEEIAIFRSLHPNRPVLAAIVEGDPPDCFPEPLRARAAGGAWHEPLATDLRPDKDGPHLGLLKLVAGLTGAGLDDLVQRDAQRRIRRVTAITGIALAAMLIMAALTLLAMDARREAERQRAEAEGLIEFMLTDLREKLKGVGSLDVLQSANERALEFYDRQQELAGLSDDSLSRRARILHAVGDDEILRGRLPRAMEAFSEAHRINAEQLARRPESATAIAEYARSEARIGRVYEERRDWPRARHHYSLFSHHARRAVAVAPADADLAAEVGWSAVNLGNVALNGTRNYQGAQHQYEEAVRWFTRAAEVRQNDAVIALNLANAYGWLADTFFQRQMWQESVEARSRQYRIVGDLRAQDLGNIEFQYRFTLAQRALARSLEKLGNVEQARVMLFEAFATSQDLAARDPDNSEWLLLRAMMGCDVYFLNLGTPDGVTRGDVRTGIRRDRAALVAQQSPRASSLANCLDAL